MNNRFVSAVLTFAPEIANGGCGAIRALGTRASQTAEVDQKRPLPMASGNDRLQIRNAPFEPIAAEHWDHFESYVGSKVLCCADPAAFVVYSGHSSVNVSGLPYA